MKLKTFALSLITFSFSIPFCNARAGIIIDDYTSGPATFFAMPNEFPSPFVQTGLNPVNALKGERSITINGVQGGQGNVVATVNVANESGKFVYDASAASAQPPFTGLIETMSVGAGDVDWRNLDSDFSVDLARNGDRFAIEVLRANIVDRFGDDSMQTFSVLVASGDPGQRLARFAGSFTVSSSNQSETYVVPFDQAPSGIDFSKVAYVEIFTANLRAGTSFSFGSIQVVPEPSTGFLVCVAMATLLRRCKLS